MKTAIEIIKILNSKGYEGYIVGGAVRDMLRGANYNDIDIATNANPEEVTELFKTKGFKVIPTGIAHGTVTLVHTLLSPKGTEVTSYRQDISCDGRNATIKFAETIEEDLSRRDLTINSIAYNPITNVYIDPFNGSQDIKCKVIRCVGNPEQRMEEDHLRMLRALRFEATLGAHWVIDRDTRNAIIKKAHLIKKISNERIKAEIDKCFTKADNPSVMIDQMRETGLLKVILPELCECYGFAQNKHHKYDVYRHTLVALDAVPKEYPLIRWAVLFHDLGKPASCENYGEPHASFHRHELLSVKIATSIMERLCFSNKDKAYINNLVKCHMFQASDELTDGAIRRFIAKLGVEYIDDIIRLKYADRKGNPNKGCGEFILSTNLKRHAIKILEEDSAFKITDLAINGSEVMELLSVPAGPGVGKVLKALLEEVLDNPSLNNKEALSEMITRGR